MPKQYEDTAASSAEVRWAILEANKPLLDKIDDLVTKIENYHQHDIDFQRKFLYMASQLLRNQQISMEGFDQLDSLFKEQYWNKGSSKKHTSDSAER